MKKPLKVNSQFIVNSNGSPKRLTKRAALNEIRLPFDRRKIVIEDAGDHWSATIEPRTGYPHDGIPF